MKTQEELNLIDIDIDYYDELSIVEGFIKLSALNRMGEFEFIRAFEYLGARVNDKLTEHAQGCTLEEFTIYMDGMFYCGVDLSDFTVKTDYIYVGEADVLNAICRLHYEKSRQAFDGMFDDLLEIQEALNTITEGKEHVQTNVILFDRIIHAQHVTGDIFDDVDIEDMKAGLDEEIVELMGIELETA